METIKTAARTTTKRRDLLLFAWSAAFALLIGGLLCFATTALAATDPAASATVKMPEVTPQMREYSHTRYFLYFFDTVYAIMVQFVLLQSGLNAYMRDRAKVQAKNPVAQFLIYYVSLYIVLCLAMVPLAFFAGFMLEHQFNLSHQTFADWALDSFKCSVMGFCLSLPALGSFFWFVRRFPKRWPILFCIIASILFGIETFISPFVLEPVLNKFTAMEPGPLKSRIQELAAKAGAPDAPVFVADKSKQTNKLNAYVSGIGSSTHIVIWDTTLAKLPADQLIAIVGHELGHYYLRHVYIDFLLAVGVNVLLIPVNMYLAPPFVARLPKRWKISGLDDFALVPVICLVATVSTFLLDPIASAWSRTQEHDADAFSLKVTENGPALARSFVSLSEQNLSEPDPPPFIEFWLFSHPSLKKRIDFALGKPQE